MPQICEAEEPEIKLITEKATESSRKNSTLYIAFWLGDNKSWKEMDTPTASWETSYADQTVRTDMEQLRLFQIVGVRQYYVTPCLFNYMQR